MSRPAQGLDGSPSAAPSSCDASLTAFATLLAVHGISASPDQLRHSLGHAQAASATDLLRLASRFPEVRARVVRAPLEQLSRFPFPALAEGALGWFLIGRVGEAGALIQLPGRPPSRIERDELRAIWSGQLLLMTTREAAGVASGRFDVRWFIPQIVKYRRLIAEVLLVTLAINILGLASPLFFQNVIDKVLVHNTSSTLTVFATGFAVVSIWEVCFGWLRTRLYSETGQKIDIELGTALFRHLLSLPIGYFETRRTGDTVTRVRQLETVREFLTNASISVLVDPLFTVVFLAVMWLISPPLLLIVLSSIVGYAVVSVLFTKPMRLRLDEKFDRGAANNALLVESVAGMQTIKAAAIEPRWQQQWERQLAAYSTASQHVVNLGNSGSQAVQLISKLSMVAILYLGAREVIAGTLTVGGLVAFNMFAQRVSGPVLKLAQLWQEFQQVRISIERLGDVLNVPTERGTESRTALPELKGSIRFEHVSFRYKPDAPLTLDEVSLDLGSGESLGIVGSSGSGKSTLTKLLQRLYTPIAGRILLDGVDIAQIDPVWLRRQIGVVLQENLLFSRSVRDNIALADPALPMDRIIAAAELAGAHEFILRLPQGYDTPVEERGVNLSGGQQQRIAIARALVTQPRVLVFDEATSALDAESEEVIQRNLRAIAHGRTLLVIAHRLSAVRQCDRILTLEQGRVVETGTHSELLVRGGRYADLHGRQFGALRGQAA